MTPCLTAYSPLGVLQGKRNARRLREAKAKMQDTSYFSPIFSPEIGMSQKFSVVYANLLSGEGGLPEHVLPDRVQLVKNRLHDSGWLELMERHDQQSFKTQYVSGSSNPSSDHTQSVSVRIDGVDDMGVGIKDFPEQGQVIHG
eukprot:1008851-Prorocentrum_minimum.AAC.2